MSMYFYIRESVDSLCRDADFYILSCLCTFWHTIPTSLFNATVDVLKEEEGGRHTPFVTNYCPQLYTCSADVRASILPPSGLVPSSHEEKNCLVHTACDKGVAIVENHKTNRHY